ncbi:MAG: hypothetical protein HOU81_02055 [Hamadaea sp.]|uniref:hypothetical protein n=1 Tax=Hamadaea sp. TaxID=2024425 RepID=UPI0018531213|nr:hypothetical protein [Hamadaea sp.]NUR69581.1 hypothetical protein [Hamadaea sp.]NUT20307.1 hypothetical protein [Hamadaea sp.]
MADGATTTRPVVRRLGTAALVLAALAIGGVISNFKPSDETQQRPFITRGGPEATVHTRSFDAKVLGVRGGEVIGSAGYVHESKGVWVIVKVQLTANHEPTRVFYAALRDGTERIFEASGRVTQDGLGGRNLQPGIPVDVEIAFEVPTEVPLDLSLRLATDSLDHRMDGMAEIGLPITRDDLTKWKSDKETMRLARPTWAGSSPSASTSPTSTPSPGTSATSTPSSTTTPKGTTSPRVTKSPRVTPTPSVRSSS